MLEGINYAIFGLGNRTYEQFCAVGIKMDKQLEKFGAERLIDVGLGEGGLKLGLMLGDNPDSGSSIPGLA